MITSDPHAVTENRQSARNLGADAGATVSLELSAQDGALSRGLLYLPQRARPRVGVHLMHPRTDQSNNYNILPLVRAGYAVLGRAGRWMNNDSATTHEHLLLDMAAGVEALREAGCEAVVLLGNSGGSSLAAFYQAQAYAAPGTRLVDTPAGDPIDLNRYRLPAADGVVIVGGHIGQGAIMGKLIDPSVIDEHDPLATDPLLDMFASENGFFAPPHSSRYSDDFLIRYRAGQRARMDRIDAVALAMIARRREGQYVVDRLGEEAPAASVRAAAFDPHMLVFRTSAYPAFTDTSIEADGRPVTSYFSPQPQTENFGAGGFGRYVTPRAWLSTWSERYSRARTIDNLASQSAPQLTVHYSGDCGTRMSEVLAMHAATAAADKTLEIVERVDHYGLRINPDGSKGDRVWTGTDCVVEWMKAKFPA